MKVGRIEIRQAELEAFCRKWRIREFSIFGSALRDDFGPDSDVDLVMKGGLRNPIRRRHILETRQVIYAA